MDILDKIRRLQKERGWSVYRLSYEAGLTQSTVANMFSRKTVPSIPTLKALCDAFGITLAQFFAEDEEAEPLTSKEKKIVDQYRLMTPKQKEAFDQFLAVFPQNP
jgi:transcriptional regulator with XRE-family HTH domain